MNRLFVLCACVAVALSAAVEKAAVETQKNDWEDWESPSFCRGLDCPVFDLMEKTEGYELRSYKSGVWVSTEREAMEFTDEIRRDMFQKLFRYISGTNEREEGVEMTAPVLTRVIPSAGPNCESTFRMSFYIEWSKQNTAPLPTESDVFLETIPAMNIYAGSFSGYASMDDYIVAVSRLGEAIGDPTKFQTSFWFTAGYDSPYQPFFRHNEAWLMARD